MAQKTSVFANTCGEDQTHGGSFLADNVKLTWSQGAGGDGGGAKGGALVQQVQFQIQRNVNMLYEIGSSLVYYVGGRRQGSATFNRVVSGSDTFRDLATKFGNICNPQNLYLNAAQASCKGESCGETGGVKYTLISATLNSVGASVSANDVVINESLGFMFTDLGYEKA